MFDWRLGQSNVLAGPQRPLRRGKRLRPATTIRSETNLGDGLRHGLVRRRRAGRSTRLCLFALGRRLRRPLAEPVLDELRYLFTVWGTLPGEGISGPRRGSVVLAGDWQFAGRLGVTQQEAASPKGGRPPPAGLTVEKQGR